MFAVLRLYDAAADGCYQWLYDTRGVPLTAVELS
jgi:hypothetical protein